MNGQKAWKDRDPKGGLSSKSGNSKCLEVPGEQGPRLSYVSLYYLFIFYKRNLVKMNFNSCLEEKKKKVWGGREHNIQPEPSKQAKVPGIYVLVICV